MSSAKHQLRWMSAIAVLLVLALGVACTGFFQNPTLTSIAIGPASPTIETGSTDNTIQMTVTGTNNDGSTTTNPSVAWTSSPDSVATISSSGLVTSVSVGTATITATANQNSSITGTQTVTVTVGCIESIKITPTSAPPLTFTGNNSSDTFSAEATTCNGPADITDVATWNAVPSTLATITSGVLTEVSGVTTTGTVAVTASVGSITSNTVNVSVGP
jgi:trimeric autotransporter adhesin